MMSYRLTQPSDFHVHLREGQLLEQVIEYTASDFCAALVMPNTRPAIQTAQDVIDYQARIKALAPQLVTLMTIKLSPETTPEIIHAASPFAVAGKLYPDGVTTGSENGVRDLRALYPVFEAMQDRDMVLSLHGEVPDAFCLDREFLFLAHMRDIAHDFPRLRIVLEHVTTKAAVEAVREMRKGVAATITVHHMALTLDDVIGGTLRPHLFCKPIAKRPHDRDAILDAAFSGDPKFFLGTDSAPHVRGAKECASGCAGIFSAPVAVPELVEIFDKAGRADLLEEFWSDFGIEFYQVQDRVAPGEIEVVRGRYVVPEIIGQVVPYRAGQVLNWRVLDVSRPL